MDIPTRNPWSRLPRRLAPVICVSLLLMSVAIFATEPGKGAPPLRKGQPPEPPFTPAEQALQAGDKPPLPKPKPKPKLPPEPLPDEIVLRDYLVLPAVGVYGRAPFHLDALEALLVEGRWTHPQPRETITDPEGIIHQWELALADRDGTLEHSALRGGYAYVQVDSPVHRVMMLEAQGHGSVLVNGEPRTGDPYGLGWLSLPVELAEGANHFIFHVGAGELSARLIEPRQQAMLDSDDATLPELIRKQPGPHWGAVVVKNATTGALDDLHLLAGVQDGLTWRSDRFSLPPLSARKVPFQVLTEAPAEAAKVELHLKLEQERVGSETLDEVTVALDVCDASQLHTRTFVSRIDGSVQHYAVLPAQKPSGGEKPGVLLTLHGASVGARQQAELYEPKSWAHIVAPTNRRPYGFDWEDWGRTDAFEALEDAQEKLGADPRKTFVSGHSMGGHGAWHLAVTSPDRFAGVAPVAGWISFASTGRSAASDEAGDIDKLLARAASMSDTLLLQDNLRSQGVYVLHGENDQNVPVAQSREMREQLGTFHPNFAYYEKPGAGHWWGEATCDWPPLLEFLRGQQLATRNELRSTRLVTTNPGVLGRSHWMRILEQHMQHAPSELEADYDSGEKRFTIRTRNVARLEIDVAHLPSGTSLRATLDGQKFGPLGWPAASRKLWFRRDEDRWSLAGRPRPSRKGPHRYGLFKDAFDHRVVFVYGTAGRPGENAWALAKARYDAETFWYRGNGSIEVIPDTQFSLGEYEDRNVVLYGNINSNSAWPALLSTCPIQVRRGRIDFAERPVVGNDLACLLIYPRADSEAASVGVVSGTGMRGFRAANRLRYFISGIAYPDVVVFDSDYLRRGTDSLRAAGFFGLDWSIEEGEFAWRDLAL